MNHTQSKQKPTAVINEGEIFAGDEVDVEVSGEKKRPGTYTATATLTGKDASNYHIKNAPENESLVNCKFVISNIEAPNPAYTIVKASDGTEVSANANGWYNFDIKIVPVAGYTIGTADDNDGNFAPELKITESKAAYTVYLRDSRGNYTGEIIVGDLNIDKTDPTVSVKLNEDNVWDTFLDVIHIKRQLGKDLSKDQSKLQPKTKTKQEIGLKTRSSDRELDIPDIVFNAIIEERKMYEVNRSRRSTTFQDLDYICCSSYGRPRSATYASSQYKALLRNNGLPDIRFHDLRHTYASMLLSEELSVKAVSNTLGHAKSIVTVDVYGDKARIIGDGTDAMRPTLEYVLPTEYITSREVGVLKKRVVYDSSIGFPEELADDIMECLLHKCA